MPRNEADWFVGRSAELEQILQLVASLRLGAVPNQSLVNICGPYGIGKTAFLATLDQRLSSDSGLRVISLKLPPLPTSHKALTLEFKLAILRQLAGNESKVEIDSLADEAAADAALINLAAKLVEHQTPVLLLVEADARSASVTFRWIESGLLLPLVHSGRAVAVITSRIPLRWREFETRRRVKTFALTPLDLTATAEQLGVTNLAAANIHELTFGLPLANELARTVLAEEPDPISWDTGMQVELARRIVATLYERVEPKLSPELRCAVEILSVVRTFPVPLFQSLLAYCDEHSQARSQDYYLIIIKQLQALDLVLWDQSALAYRVALELRPLFSETLRRTDPDLYGAIQRTACDYYRQILEGVVVSRHIHVVELLWNSLNIEENKSSPPVLLRDLVSSYLTSPDGQQVDQEALADLRAQLVVTDGLPAILRRRHSDLDELIAVLDITTGMRT